MGKEILYSLATNELDDLVMADTALRGRTYFCPSCKVEMVFRIGEKVRPHFAHKNLSHHCSPKTVLHFGLKRPLVERISRALDAGDRLTIESDCEACDGSHKGSLLKRATHVQEEYNLGACRPDIGLLGNQGNAVAAIEIVVKYSPDQSTIA